MIQARGEPDLAHETLPSERLGQIGVEHFHRDVAVVPDVAREVHRGHAARAELALDAVALGEGAR